MRVVFAGQDRVAWRHALYSVVSLGVTRRMWLFRVNKEVDGHQALGLDHRLIAGMLWAALGAPVLAIIALAAGWPKPVLAVAALFLVPGTIVSFQTFRRTRTMLEGSGIRHGPHALLWAISLVPFLGSAAVLAWVQSRLNRFWAAERAIPGHGIEIDIDLTSDPTFLVELGQALKESYEAGSRFDEGKRRRQERRAERTAWWSSVQAERRRVRAAGGSTPLLPWLRPTPPPRRVLHVACGRCETRFDVLQDPLQETPVVCPTCALAEVLPSLHNDPLAGKDRAQVPAVRATCPSCQLAFQVVRNLEGPTPITCPRCGTTEELPAPGQVVELAPAKAGRAKPAKPGRRA